MGDGDRGLWSACGLWSVGDGDRGLYVLTGWLGCANPGDNASNDGADVGDRGLTMPEGRSNAPNRFAGADPIHQSVKATRLQIRIHNLVGLYW